MGCAWAKALDGQPGRAIAVRMDTTSAILERPTEGRILVDRAHIQRRWSVSVDTVRRRERAGILTPIRLGTNIVRYDLAEVEAYERQAVA